MCPLFGAIVISGRLRGLVCLGPRGSVLEYVSAHRVILFSVPLTFVSPLPLSLSIVSHLSRGTHLRIPEVD